MKPRLNADSFVASQPEQIRNLLILLRKLIDECAPDAEEKAVPGGLLYQCGFHHIKLSAQETYLKLTVGVEPFSEQEMKTLGKAGLTHGKYTVQFKPGQKIPEPLIAEIVRKRCLQGTASPSGEKHTIDFCDAPDAFLSAEDREFILAFDAAMKREGYVNDGIQPYTGWGKHVISYYRAGVKTKRYVARFYLRSDELLFRMYFSDIDRHADEIERLPEDMKAAFFSEYGRCKHCDSKSNKSQGKCMHRKTYSLEGKTLEMCDGLVFLFPNHSVEAVPQYIELLRLFYPPKKQAE